MKHILYLFVVLLAISCTQKEKSHDRMVVYLSLNNKDIENAIIEYRAEIEKANAREINKGDSVYVGV